MSRLRTESNRISLEIEAGEFVAILGPSSNGKSTLYKCNIMACDCCLRTVISAVISLMILFQAKDLL
jgi:ABC-type phosphate/phosphonate transport system ATPase subunit